MESINGFFGYYECVFLKDHHIRDKEFIVTIPSLFNIPNQYEYNEAGTTSTVDTSNMLTGSTKPKESSISTQSHIVASNHTDYYYRLRGDIFKETMEGTDGITEPKAMSGKGNIDYESHEHEIRKPMSLFKFTFENLNNIIVKKGTKAYGFFINGNMDVNSFAVTRIAGAVPLAKSDRSDYLE